MLLIQYAPISAIPKCVSESASNKREQLQLKRRRQYHTARDLGNSQLTRSRAQTADRGTRGNTRFQTTCLYSRLTTAHDISETLAAKQCRPEKRLAEPREVSLGQMNIKRIDLLRPDIM